ncbi:MAG TPA: DNA polymerase, partial [Thermoanaerobaculia bacterium]|nr:DNA polymerase [Thermoanaerobaculia bacterium]
MPWVRRALEAYRIPILELQGYEADDVLGSLACRAAEAGYEVVLVSADKDLMQLVEPRVSLYHTGRTKLYGPKEVEEDFGVPPAKVADVLALMGDSIDNIPGVPGIGEKGAKSLIQEYGSLEELLARAGEVPRKAYREGLVEHQEQARLSKELSTIHTNLELAFDPAALRLDAPDPDALRQLFTELEFFSLVEELKSTPPSAGQELPPIEEAATPEAWNERTAGLAEGGKEIFLAVLGEERPIGLAAGADGETPVIFADLRRDGMRAAALASLERWIGDPETRLSGHNLKEVLRLSSEGRGCRAELFDAMLISYLLKPSVHGHTLDELALERLSCKPLTAREVGWDRGQDPPIGDSRLAAYACERVTFARRMTAAMRAELGTDSLAKVYSDIEAPLLPVLLGMEELGILLDVHFLRDMSAELGKELGELEEEVYRLAGERFNLNSPQQLGVLLFEKLGLPVLRRTQKTKSYSTGAETLEELAARGYPIAESLLRYRELTKLKSTYIDALPLLVGADGR